MKSEIFYSLNVEDIQTVAMDLLDRELTRNEIDLIKVEVAKKINWFDSIADSINEFIL